VPSVHPRCGQHGLVAPDGLCVLCRKASSGPPQPAPEVAVVPQPRAAEEPQESAGKFAALLAGLALLTMAATFVLSMGAPKPGGPRQAAALAAAPTAAPIEPDLSDLDRSKAKDLAASLKLLELGAEERHQAEDDRLQQQQLAAAQAEEQRIAAAEPEPEEARAAAASPEPTEKP
jgi:hypothetical protein